jgi:hypothetical protein
MAHRDEQEPAANASPTGLSVIGLARSTRRRFELTRARELHALLETTFLPGALLLVISSAQNGAGLRTPKEPSAEADRQAGTSRDPTSEEIEEARSNVRATLELARDRLPGRSGEHPDQRDATALITYVEMLPHKSPRVVYNLACYYSLASETDTEHRHAHLELAFEYLRQSISRTPPLERRGLLEHARDDPDLVAVIQAYPGRFQELCQLIPDGQRARDQRSSRDGA